jgi:hypothetical protein
MATDKASWEQIPGEELERCRDAEWALHDPEVQMSYECEWVVAFERQIIAHGPDARLVAAQAEQIVPGQAHRLVFCVPEDPDIWLRHTADPGPDSTDA